MKPPLIAAVAVVSLALFAASLAKVLAPAKATATKATEAVSEGTSVIPKTIRVVNIYPKMPDKLPPVVPMPALPVTPVTPVTPAVVAAAALVDPEPAVPQVEPRRHYRHMADAGDICTAHHLRKVFTHGGKSWRCRHG